VEVPLAGCSLTSVELLLIRSGDATAHDAASSGRFERPVA
jgi:hypothetical protein